MLNRIIRCTEGKSRPIQGAPNSWSSSWLDDERGASTPGVSGAYEEGDVPLEGEDITRYRSAVARCNYMAADRPDCVFAIKEGCREMSKPTTGAAACSHVRG